MRSLLIPKLLKQLRLLLDGNNIFYYTLLVFCAFLPFQFALNPYSGIDLAVIRILIPIMFLIWLFITPKNKLLLFKLNWITYLLGIFLILASISLFFSPNLSWSMRKLFFPLSIAPLYFLAATILNNIHKQKKAFFFLVSGATILALVGIIQFISQFIFGVDRVSLFLSTHIAPFFLGKTFATAVFTYPSWLINSDGTTYMRAVAIFPDPHMLSYYLGMLIPFSIALWATANSHKKWLLFSIISLIIADILTFTRGGYLALIAGGLIILPLVSIKTAKKILAGAVIFVCLFIIAPHNPVTSRLSSSFDVQEGSNQARLSNWQQAIALIKKHPFGVGIGGYSLAIKPQATYREPIYAHNAYLDIAAELGLIAAAVFIGILLFAFKNFWNLSKNEQFFIAGVASITIFATHSLVENPLYSLHVLPLFLIILALSTLKHTHEETTNPK
ncbi:MAG: hypothetical protein US25_C0019G0009 [Candidatus Moranbacteria bacterium GW2011_GWE1_36_7]|nr:MAG: hypothetical protein UR99_C0015G0022 [Candidatus Moranbacteria bacterium GW2011_GWD2_36_12]KKQ06387.1 MAG: hypothetical protein US16_C0018G0021 [Candidatus Moranbacteria bacterium GW2011_GWE2_36_40]KKQ14827.1 MAG: hypothetical protein US25_C0019G0009 [Candidatus Moranbacteria bacterium GW2011_GWE1_36_7]